MKSFILVDGNNLGYAAQAGRPEADAAGRPVHAIAGVLRKLAYLHKSYPASLPVVLWDAPSLWRTRVYPEYKAQRDATPEQRQRRAEWQLQRPRLQCVLALVGLPQLEAPQAEADDIAAQLAPRLARHGAVLLYTSDRDWWQLVEPRVLWRRATKPPLRVSHADFAARTGHASPEAYRDAKLIAGDAGDNVPGLPGFGERIAQRLLAEFGSLDTALAARAAGRVPDDRFVRAAWKALADEDGRLAQNRLLLDLACAPRCDWSATRRFVPSADEAKDVAPWVNAFQTELSGMGQCDETRAILEHAIQGTG